MTLEDLKEAVESKEEWAERELQELKNKGGAIPEQDGEWIANMWETSNESLYYACLLYTSPSPRDGLLSRMPSSA